MHSIRHHQGVRQEEVRAEYGEPGWVAPGLVGEAAGRGPSQILELRRAVLVQDEGAMDVGGAASMRGGVWSR